MRGQYIDFVANLQFLISYYLYGVNIAVNTAIYIKNREVI